MMNIFMETVAIRDKNIAKYKNQWVALVRGEVVAARKDLRAVKEKIERKNMKNYFFHLVPSKPLALYEKTGI